LSATLTWIDPPIAQPSSELLDLAGPYPLLASLLSRRGIQTRTQALAFLDPRHYTPTPPTELDDLGLAADRIERAIRKRERIGIWGDFDVDGQTSTTLLYAALQRLGADVVYHIPVRKYETHGVNIPGLQRFIEQGVRLFLTCDTGITAQDAVHFAQQNGLDFLITDHHTLPPELPPALAVVNPQRCPANHPLRSLPGVGVAYKLAEELHRRAGRLDDLQADLDLVALGIVADLAILSGDARYLVQRGLDVLREAQRPGLRALLQLAEVTPAQLNETHIGFIIGPRLNALGRLDDANPIVPFLTTADPTLATVTATRLEALNAQRKLLCDQVFQGAQAQLRQNPRLLDEPVLILSHEHWPAGVVGIVASRLVELYQRPTILLVTPPGQAAHGSARSVEGINITAAIAAQADLLNGFGGHPMAAGLSLPAERIPEFRRRLARTIQATETSKPQPELQIDAYLTFSELTLELIETLERMAPFGPGNPPPLFASRQLTLESVTPIGKTKEHLQLLVRDPDGETRKVLWWQGADSPLPEGPFDLAYTARASNFRGQLSLQMEWVHARPLERPTISLPQRPPLMVLDQRFCDDPLTQLQEYQTQPETLIWREGDAATSIAGVGRAELRAAKTLVIYTTPPGLKELQAALNIVQPETVILFAVQPVEDSLPAFLQRLSGLIQHVLNKRAGRIALQELSSAAAQCEWTVRVGLEWLAANAQIVFTEQAGIIELSKGAPTKNRPLPELQADLKALLTETAAFRAYYRRTDAQLLIESARD